MAWRPDPLLLELFESMHKDLATALDARQRLHDAAAADYVTLIEEQTGRIARLRIAIAEVEGALELRESRVVH